MLSIQPLKSAEGAAAYYLDVVNYYANDSKSIQWLGKGAKALDIHGKTVEKNQMLALLKGILPNGTQLGRINKEGIHHRPGFDMTLSAPKSFSILLESGADPRLAKVFDEAVAWFVNEMEQEFAQARQIVNGKVEYIDTQNLVIAAFRQPNSRANDPQTHTHLVGMNMTMCPDEKWRSLASDMTGQKGVVEQIMKHHIYGGLKFRNKLASLTKELGHELETTGDGLWEIKGVPEDVITFYSKRRGDIEQCMENEGWSGAKAASIATQKTKKDKEIVDFEQWKKDILIDCKARGFDPFQLVKESCKPEINSVLQTIKEKIMERFYGRENLEINQAKEAVYIAIESVSQQEAVFDRRTLKKEALKYSIASNMIVDERLLDRMIDANIESQELYQAEHPFTKKTLLTTPWQLTLESETVQRIENGKGAFASICSKQEVGSFIKAKEQEMGFSLSPSQKRAITGFLTTTDRFIAIQGYAGTGKTTMLRLTRELASLHGYTIRGVTAGSAAAHELRTKGGLDAATFARELGRLKNQKQDLSKTIFVVDEASMLSNPQGHKIIKLVEQFNTQLVVTGDRAQLPSPSSGKMFAVTQDYGMDTVVMTDNLRQTDPDLKESAIHASLGEIYDAVEKLSHVEALESYEERIIYTANRWLSLTPMEREKTLCFAPTHKNRHDITAILRNSLVKEGVLTGTEHTQSVLREKNLSSIMIRKAPYYTGDDVIRFNINIPKYHIKAGDYVRVEAVNQHHKNNNTLSLLREDGKSFIFKLSALPAFKTQNKDLERPLEVYRKHLLPVMAGDKIQWKRNFEKMGVRNAELATIKNITESGIEILSQDNQLIYLDKKDKALQHLDHGYALTTYAAQGKDKKRGICLLDSRDRFATTIQNYYVGTTRGIEEMTVVTDDRENLVKAITMNDSDKYSSLEMVSLQTLKSHDARFKDNKHSLVLQNVIEKKLIKEEEWKILENTVESYVQQKENRDNRKSAQIAFGIVHNPTLYRIAKERLGYSEYAYRKDALKVETSRIFHTLTPSDKALFSVVRQYVLVNQQIANKAAHINKHAVNNTTSSHQKQVLQTMSARRNALAGVISQELTQFKPFLKHFSIGELNRIGLSQAHYGKESRKAISRLESLAKHAARASIGTQVTQYLKASDEKKEALAALIKRDARVSHPFVLNLAREIGQKPEVLWKSIQKDARANSDRLFRNGLNPEGRAAFDAIKTYKEIQLDLRNTWATGLKEAEKSSVTTTFDAKSTELLTRRNALAHHILKQKATPEIATYFKLDLKTLSVQDQKHQYRENISRFINNKGNFSLRLDAINAIKNDIKGHYPYIKEARIDSRILTKYLRVTDRSERFASLSLAETRIYKQFLQYKAASTNTFKLWQQVHHPEIKASPEKKELINQAMVQSAKRDNLAYRLKDSPYLDSILSYEKGNKEKIEAHATNHQLKLREVSGVNEALKTLSIQYNTVVSSQSRKAVSAWKSQWFSLSSHAEQLARKAGHQYALKENPVSLALVETINKDLEKQYQVKSVTCSNFQKEASTPALKSIQKTAQYLDAKTVNEYLMANPEQTYTAIWGEPKSQNPRELRYSGGLLVTLKGKDRGLWHDFCNGVGGAPIQAIMARDNIAFKEALEQAAKIAGMDEYRDLSPNVKSETAREKTPSISRELENKNRILSARSIWNGSVDARGTLAEKYLQKHRGLDNAHQLDIRFWQKGTAWINCNDKGILEEKINQIPALVFAARNEKNEITGVQRIYLDSRTATKNTFMDEAKLSKGIIEGSCGIIQKGMRGSRLYIAEGAENGASIAMADRKATVVCSFGISNIRNLAAIIKKHKPCELVIAGDNDGAKAESSKVINSIIENYKQQGINVMPLLPKPIEGHLKTDWNDVLKIKGISEIQKQLTIFNINNIHKNSIQSFIIPDKNTMLEKINTMKLNEKHLDSTKTVSANIEKNQNMNQWVSSYIKNNISPVQTQSPQVEKSVSVKITREAEMEL